LRGLDKNYTKEIREKPGQTITRKEKSWKSSKYIRKEVNQRNIREREKSSLHPEATSQLNGGLESEKDQSQNFLKRSQAPLIGGKRPRKKKKRFTCPEKKKNGKRVRQLMKYQESIEKRTERISVGGQMFRPGQKPFSDNGKRERKGMIQGPDGGLTPSKRGEESLN